MRKGSCGPATVALRTQVKVRAAVVKNAHEMIETMGHAVIIADTDGEVSQLNRGAETLFGYRADETIGNSLDLIVPKHLQEAHWASFHRAMSEPPIKDLAADLRARCSDAVK
ncbi:PAS domain S-box-containing protein [Brevibacterium sandarakinum]|uniref:PAS domain S-box-containing protein n=1 Tax=Brevibacterium sandarakinum TaxID=629680 RepID=A0A1H1NVV2_BRESA|nr:PAS domain-containing protein [Brevibacterium sandarakinum]SDS03108.1 PAS domain S-box-containing protein [Brevibacterium sandarakinum]